jgi:hypothetical protein
MKYAVEMGSGGMIYIPRFIKFGSDIQKLIRWGYTHRQQDDVISVLLFFQNKESRLKVKIRLLILMRPTHLIFNQRFTLK